jgi:hypothetical protein
MERKGFGILKSGSCHRNRLCSAALVAVNSLALCVDCEGCYVAYVPALVDECQLRFIVAGWQLFARDAHQNGEY